MAITQAMCTSFKKELLEGKHNFTNGAHTKPALFYKFGFFGCNNYRLQHLK